MGKETIPLERHDGYWLELARLLSYYSNDPYTKVGCVIVDKKGMLIGGAFNFIPDVINPSLISREEKNSRAVHAEDHALRIAGNLADGATAYLWPVEPCHECAKILTKAGVTRVVSRVDQESEVFVRWHDNLQLSRRHFLEKGITLSYMNTEQSSALLSEAYSKNAKERLPSMRLLWQK